ncbi:MAG: TetR family transcriptional regulator [Gemmatimonadaceae bacterium]|nr:TetR family transcriptional regulator [Gemmatimonadaceae bacterium]MCW5826963.1 TetR family transcriptional regulator [Gemmatimonadaceae bacterium]
MSRADAPLRILDAAAALGAGQGVGALSIQAVAKAAGVSKALVLYHFHDKDTLLAALVARLIEREAGALTAAAAAADALEAWRATAADDERRRERAALAALLQEAALQAQAPALVAPRVAAAAALGQAMLAAAGLRSRVPSALLGRVLLQHLDGVALSARDRTAAALEPDLDAFALALLALGR